MALREGPPQPASKLNREAPITGDAAKVRAEIAQGQGRDRTGWTRRRRAITAAITAPIVGAVAWATLIRPKHSAESSRDGIAVTASPSPDFKLNNTAPDTALEGLPVAKAPPTEATTTTIPGVFQTDEGKVLNTVGYSSSNAEKLGDVKAYQAIDTSHRTEVLSYLDLRYNPEGGKTVQKAVEDLARSERTYTINPYGTGEVVVQIAPKPENPDRKGMAIYLPLDKPHPPSFSEFNGKTVPYGSTKRNTSESVVKLVDKDNPDAAIQANQLAIIETFWREVDFKIISQAPGVSVDPTIAGEVVANYYGKIWGQQVSGNPASEVQRSMKRTINVAASSVPLQLPAFAQEVYDEGPGAKGKIFG